MPDDVDAALREADLDRDEKIDFEGAYIFSSFLFIFFVVIFFFAFCIVNPRPAAAADNQVHLQTPLAVFCAVKMIQ